MHYHLRKSTPRLFFIALALCLVNCEQETSVKMDYDSLCQLKKSQHVTVEAYLSPLGRSVWCGGANDNCRFRMSGSLSSGQQSAKLGAAIIKYGTQKANRMLIPKDHFKASSVRAWDSRGNEFNLLGRRLELTGTAQVTASSCSLYVTHLRPL